MHANLGGGEQTLIAGGNFLNATCTSVPPYQGRPEGRGSNTDAVRPPDHARSPSAVRLLLLLQSCTDPLRLKPSSGRNPGDVIKLKSGWTTAGIGWMDFGVVG